ncbi:DNA polymerase epsilon catalytic subunit A [Astathelohania contejeani]|uniref:DNA polymerase epsilon catalytic subunit n=1 Tax=Astathelohania contejeani TaxID=164912 RepID=A0ABQ7I0T4_9MICR|nr:DNA polymerase epsilon catalytic subunit A [Thelohania contejeani]
MHKEEKISLREQFGFVDYWDTTERHGWLINFEIESDINTALEATLYFVENESANFVVRLPFYPSLLVEATENNSVEEYLKRKYASDILKTEMVDRTDVSQYNHLSLKPTTFIKIYFSTENGFYRTLKELKEIVRTNKIKRQKESIYADFLKYKRCDESETEIVKNIQNSIIKIHEYDIPHEIKIAVDWGIRCGSWYTVTYEGEKYNISACNNLVPPLLRIFSFDIETTKQPLKFPNAENDQIMMISIMSDQDGYLIINREIVSEDIEEFEYTPKQDIGGKFKIYNELNEEGLIIRFIELIQMYQPHIITTYNGSSFDFPFLEKRAKKFNLLLQNITGFNKMGDYYTSPFIVHLDCYKWVKRDSYLPMGSQGLKAVTKVKLGYFPDEINPELMVEYARTNPDKLASYSVSDAVATYSLYIKYVHPFIYSLCTLIPLPPHSVLEKGSGTLCESLLIAEADHIKLLIPPRKAEDQQVYYKGHLAENINYVGGHVECLKSGIYRSDFPYNFKINRKSINFLIENLELITKQFKNEENWNIINEKIKKELTEMLVDDIMDTPYIYHLDVAAMYPNIIITNRLQPISIIKGDECVRCDYNPSTSNCQREMTWKLRAEYYPPSYEENEMIKNQLEKETFNGIIYSNLSMQEQNRIFKERLCSYSKQIYHKLYEKEIVEMKNIVCQREIPFYVDAIRRFRDKRYYYKEIYKKLKTEYLNAKSNKKELERKLVIYESLQVAHKCILNSFYGYVMRKGSRWHSTEMAAIVCNTGGEIIRMAKDFIEDVGTVLELDTDGVWCLLPHCFPTDFVYKSGKKISFICMILNYLIEEKFTNLQNQELKDGEYITSPSNSIQFEIDGPYKAMILPSSTEEAKSIKKRYLVIDYNGNIAELKGFEFKRRGELNIIKKLQEELFSVFTHGNTIEECYSAVGKVCEYWLNLIDQQGECLSDEELFELFAESKNMSKSLKEYGGRRTTSTCTAERLVEFLGPAMAEDPGLRCEYIISAFPEGVPITNRAIPVDIFLTDQNIRDNFLRRWIGQSPPTNIRKMFDWEYYRGRVNTIIQKMVVIPAITQGLPNPVKGVTAPEWTKKNNYSNNLQNFNFFVKKKIQEDEKNNIECNNISAENKHPNTFSFFIKNKKDKWINKLKDRRNEIIKLEFMNNGKVKRYFYRNNKILFKEIKEDRIIHVISNGLYSNEHFKVEECEVLIDGQRIYKLIIPEDEFIKKKKLFYDFFNRFGIKKVYDSLFELDLYNKYRGSYTPRICTIISFSHQKKIYYVVGIENTYTLITETDFNINNLIIYKNGINQFLKEVKHRIIYVATGDINKGKIKESINQDCILIELTFKRTIFLSDVKTLIINSLGEVKEMEEIIKNKIDLSLKTRIPICNIHEMSNYDILDILFYREMRDNNFLVNNEKYEEFEMFKEETYLQGYYEGISVEVECVGTLLISIMEDTREDISEEYILLRLFIKKILNQNLPLIHYLERWIKIESKIISTKLKIELKLLQKKFLMTLINKIRSIGCTIISVNKQILLLFIGNKQKFTFEYIQCIINKEFQFLKLREIRKYKKLIYVNPMNYFFMREDEQILSFSSFSIPLDYLEKYFEGKVENNYFYSMVDCVDNMTMLYMLKMEELRREGKDITSLRSNCCKLMGVNEFSDKADVDKLRWDSIEIICEKCESENILRISMGEVFNACIKCYAPYSIESMEYVCMTYVNKLTKLELICEGYCEKCGTIKERRLADYCGCGGRYKPIYYRDKVLAVLNVVNTEVMKEYVDMMLLYYH